MGEQNINDMMRTTMDKIRELVDANTVVGTPITTPDGITLIPITKVSFGFGVGGSDVNDKQGNTLKLPALGTGSGAGISIKPVSFLVISDGHVRVLPVASSADTTVDRIIDLMPEIVDKISNLAKGKRTADEFDE